MLQTYEAVLSGGQLEWIDPMPAITNARVFVTVQQYPAAALPKSSIDWDKLDAMKLAVPAPWNRDDLYERDLYERGL
jgi:hypothetical protein